MTLRFSLLLVSTLVLFGCYDYEPRVEQVYQEVMDWGSFKKGSWWVYQEDSSKLLDTILVFHHEIVANDFMYDIEYGVNRVYTESVRSFFYSSRGIDSGFYELSSISSMLMVRGDNKSRRWSYDYDYCQPVIFPIIQGKPRRGNGPDNILELDTIYPKFSIAALEFSGVVRVSESKNQFYNKTPSVLYSAKHIGIIRKEFPELKQVWNLIDYHIEQ